MRCVRARPSLATRWRRAHRGRSSEGCSCPYLFRWRSLREEWSCGALWCSFPDKPPKHSESRWGRERGRSIPFSDLGRCPIESAKWAKADTDQAALTYRDFMSTRPKLMRQVDGDVLPLGVALEHAFEAELAANAA